MKLRMTNDKGFDKEVDIDINSWVGQAFMADHHTQGDIVRITVTSEYGPTWTYSKPIVMSPEDD